MDRGFTLEKKLVPEISVNRVCEILQTSAEEQSRFWQLLRAQTLVITQRLKEAENELGHLWNKKIDSKTDLSDLARLLKQKRRRTVSGRGLNKLAGNFGLSVHNFLNFVINKKILNVGAGDSQLGQQVNALGMKADFTSLDIDHEAMRCQPETAAKVEASATLLPFRSQEFDSVLLTWLLSHFFESKEFTHILLEARRVTKIGGFT